MKIAKTIEVYLSSIKSDPFHRFASWNNCFQTFSTSEQTNQHALALAFYLASWGMYRGSSGLLQKNHLIHQGAVDIIFSDLGKKLKCSDSIDVRPESLAKIIDLKHELSEYYGKIVFSKDGDNKKITPTNTLLSKVMLGTLGCVPAYDRYFIAGLNANGIKETSFDEDALKALFSFMDKNKAEIQGSQKLIREETGWYYPLMKIVDMYFWQTGYDEEKNASNRSNP